MYEMADEMSKKLSQKELWTFKFKKYVKESIMSSAVSRFKSLVDQLDDGVGAEVKEHDKTMNSLLNNLLETWDISVKAWIE
jgi:predicted ATPase